MVFLLSPRHSTDILEHSVRHPRKQITFITALCDYYYDYNYSSCSPVTTGTYGAVFR
jgi:hypothetical protein